MPASRDDDPEPVGRARYPRELIAGGVAARESFVDWMTRLGERAGTVLVYSSAYIATIAMAEVAIAMVLLSVPPNVSPIAIGLVTFAVYTSDRISDAATDMVSNPKQAEFVLDHKEGLSVLAALAYGLAVTLAVLHGPTALAVTLVPGLFWIAYASDWVPDVVVRFRRLKELLVVNSAVVALAWAVTLTLLPLSFTNAPLSPTAGVVFAYFFLRSFVDTEIPNVRDVDGDRAIGVATLPATFGVATTRRALYGIDLLTVLLLAVATRAGYLGLTTSIVLALGILVSLGVIAMIGRTEAIENLSIASQFEYLVVVVLLAILA